MTCAERIRRIRVLDQIKEYPEYAEKIGLTDASKFRRKNIKHYQNYNVIIEERREL